MNDVAKDIEGPGEKEPTEKEGGSWLWPAGCWIYVNCLHISVSDFKHSPPRLGAIQFIRGSFMRVNIHILCFNKRAVNLSLARHRATDDTTFSRQKKKYSPRGDTHRGLTTSGGWGYIL